MIGRSLGRYRVVEKIGSGAMGKVYRAHDAHLKRDVALKIFPAGGVPDDNTRKRFHKEALALSRLNHPNIATVHDFDTVDGVDFIVMELVPGESLDKLIARGPLPIDDAISLAVQLASGLGAAHAHGVVHRDLKPGNLSVTPEGNLKILDFGLAKLFKPTGVAETQEHVTNTHARAGTLGYMSPEQIRGERITAVSDLFSFGIVLYEMITGRHPFEATHSQSLAYNILNSDPPPPSTVRGDVPDEISSTTMRLLAKSPEDRFATAGEAAETLRGVARPVSTKRRRGAPFTVGVGIGAVVVTLAVLLLAFLRQPGSTYSAQLTGTVRQLTFSGEAAVPLWSPDGRHIAFTEAGQVQVIASEGGTPRQLETGSKNDIAWGWMPDGSAVLTHSFREERRTLDVLKVGLYGETPQTLIEDAYFGAMSPDGKTLLYTSTDWDSLCVCRQDMATGKKTVLAAATEKGTAAYKPLWSPDGKKISYVRWNGTGHEIWLINPDGSDDHMVDTGPIDLGGRYDWGNNGRSLIIGGELHGIWSIWEISLESRDKHRRLTVNSSEDRHVTFAPDGRRFTFQRTQEVSRVALFDVASAELSYPFDLSVATRQPVFSSRGSHLYFQALVNARWQIWRAPLQVGEGPKPVLVRQEMSCFKPAPGEGDGLLYIQARVGRVWRFGRIGWSQTLWSSNADGGSSVRIDGAGERVERVAPGGWRSGKILYSVNDPENNEIVYVLDQAGTSTEIFKDSQEQYVTAFEWGPGDNEVLIAHTGSGYLWSAKVISNIDTETLEADTLLTAGELDSVDTSGGRGRFDQLALSPTRDKLAIIAYKNGQKIFLYEFASGRVELLHQFEEGENPGTVAWSPDGKFLAFALLRQKSDIFIWEPADDTSVAQR